MSNSSLPRKYLILKYTVEHFIKTANPVGSKTLIDEFNLPFSSATIRSEMNELENDGYLEKTHTSSGRIPSTKGYHYYVDNLRNRSVDEEIKFQLQQLITQKSQSIEEVIKKSCEILAHMTNLASIVLGPNAQEEKLISIRFVPISETTATAVFITDRGYVENKTFIFNENVSLNDLEKCVLLLDQRLSGTPIYHLLEKMEAIRPILQDYIAEHDVIYQAFSQAFLHFAGDRIKLFGRGELYEQPEFRDDAKKLRNLISLLDSPSVIRDVTSNGSDISIKIGEFGDDNKDISIISTKLHVPGQKEGTIALVGPTRMDYARVINALEYLAELLETHFTINKEGK